MKGLDVYKTKEGFTVAQLHYSADPTKIKLNGKPVDYLLEGYIGGMAGAAWRKEMEIDFTAYSGQLLCYDILTNYRHKIVTHYPIEPYYNQFGSLDWGRNNPASFHIYTVGKNKHVHSTHEIYQNNTSIPNFCNLIKHSPGYQQLKWISADPSVWNRTQETKEGLRSLNDMFMDEGVILRKGKSRDDEIAINELMDRWYKLESNEARFTISPKCPMQIWEFERLRYKEITTAMIEKQNPHETLIDKDNHSWDDFKYFISTWLSEPVEDKEPEFEPMSLEAWERRLSIGKEKKFA